MSLPAHILRLLADIAGSAHIAEPNVVRPGNAAEVAAVLQVANAEHVRVRPRGSATPSSGADASDDVVVSLARLNAVSQYEPADLTASVQAGTLLADLSDVLGAQRQWLPLGVAEPASTTIGAAVASNEAGPYRLYYGNARDMVIGMRFATPQGKLIKTGGMVVKNVAGYDMAKLLIGSVGTLGIITDVNVKVFPRPASATALLSFTDLNSALEARNRFAHSVLAPLAMDLLNAQAAECLRGALPDAPFVLAVAFGGVEAVLERNRREAEAIAQASVAEFEWLADAGEQALWRAICALPATIAARRRGVARVKLSSTLQDMKYLLGTLPAGQLDWMGLVARAGSGISYLYADGGDITGFCAQAIEMAVSLGGFAVVESAPAAVFAEVDAWGPRRDDHACMRKLKDAFDPEGVLNPGRFVC